MMNSVDQIIYIHLTVDILKLSLQSIEIEKKYLEVAQFYLICFTWSVFRLQNLKIK